MIIPLKSFTGEFPRLARHLLPDNAAQLAQDCDFSRGTLTGLSNPDPVAGVSGADIRAFFVYEGGAAAGNRFWWNRDVDAVRSPVVNDNFARFYWSDDSGFYVSRGDLGGNGEPSDTNRYMVGVPRPSAPLVLESAELRFPGIARVMYELYDEVDDGGSLLNHAEVTPGAMTKTATGMTFSFTARAPTYRNAEQIKTKPVVPAATQWRVADTVVVGGLNVPVYVNTADSRKMVLYYDDKVSMPSVVRVWHWNNPDYAGGTPAGDGVYSGDYFRLGNTNWYGKDPNTVPPNQAGAEPTETKEVVFNAAIKGPVLKARFVREGGGESVALIRAENSTWPVEMQGYIGTLTYDGGTSWTLSISVAGGNTLSNRAYVYTYVNQYGEEGAASDPVDLDCVDETSVVMRYSAPPSGYCPISKIRVYRTATGTTTDFMFVGEVSVNSAVPIFTDAVTSASLGEPLTSAMYYPPDQGLRGICMMANGIMVGFRNNEVHFSEPYLPYAWNPTAIKSFPQRIVGVCPFEGGLYVTTTAHPHIVMGASPVSMTDARIPAIQAGVSKGGIVDLGGQVAYASNDGIVLAQGMAASLDLSFKFFTRAEWREMYGDKLHLIRLSAHDGALVVWFEDGTPGFMLRFEEESLSMTRLTNGWRAAFVNPVDDSLYVSDGTTVVAFRAGGGRMPFVWRSKDFITARPTSFGAIQLTGTGTVAIEVYADDVLRHTQSVALDDIMAMPLRLPSGFLSRKWSLKLSGSGEVFEANISNTVAELRNV